MKRDIRNKRWSHTRGHRQYNWRLIIAAVAFLSLVLALVVFVYQYRKAPEQFPRTAGLVTKMTTWVAEHKKSVSHGIGKVKKLAMNKEGDDEPQIHFEFYSALPNMRVDAKMANDKLNTGEQEETVASNNVFKADELEHEFFEKMQPTKTKRSVS